MEDRLQKILSAAGVCSRRRAETYIQQGRVTVNGRPGVLGERADPDRDQIALDGVPVGRRGDHQVLMLYKPRGVVTTLSDEKGRPTVADLVRDCGERVWPVGRLDMDSEGLLLLTGDRRPDPWAAPPPASGGKGVSGLGGGISPRRGGGPDPAHDPKWAETAAGPGPAGPPGSGERPALCGDP